MHHGLLDGVRVTINGQAAFVSYISPEQVNALVPSSVAAGPASVTVTNGALTSPPQTVTVNVLQPEVLMQNDTTLVAQFPDGTYVTGAGYLPSRFAKSGDTIALYGIGFGPVVPVTPAGEIVTQLTSLQATFQVIFRPPVSAPVSVTYAGLAPGFTGLYQFNFIVPDIPASAFPPGSSSLSLLAYWTLNGIAGSPFVIDISR